MAEGYLPFDEAHKVAMELGLKTAKEWKGSVGKSVPKDVPVVPDMAYKGKGWKSWTHWLTGK